MLVSKQWLQEFVDVRQKTGQELADLITKSGIEVECVEVRDADLKQYRRRSCSDERKTPGSR